MDHDLLYARMQASGLSLWELGELLGIHPHHLHKSDTAGGLPSQPVRVLIELAYRLDLHPADLVPALDAGLGFDAPRPPASRSAPPTATPLTLLTRLTTTSATLDIDELAAPRPGCPAHRVRARARRRPSYPDPEHNRIIVEVDGYSDAMLWRMAAKHGGTAVAVRVVSSVKTLPGSGEADTSQFYGGAKITNCTAGLPGFPAPATCSSPPVTAHRVEAASRPRSRGLVA
ncbi:hypothetical protein AB0H83_39565 [Dactylosporangium sp. NPDC050688]|uniref:hypothetical protein n=1 Tax=Dactylosporangium sp. NPDC050688 TaxID=3157217 RepID=UPI0033CA44CF